MVEKSRDFWSSGSHQCPQNALCRFSLQRKPSRHRMIFWFGTRSTPHELFPWEYAMKRKPPPDPRHRYWMPEELFPSVVRSHRAVMRWRQPRSIHLCDEHGCVQLVDAGGETTRRREPRGVSGTLEVSPTGSIPHRENPARQVANDKVEASRARVETGTQLVSITSINN